MKQQHHSSIKTYLTVFGALMVLTVTTVLVSYFDLPTAPAIALGLAIATVKASLVAAFFMHLKGERLLIYGLLTATLLTAVLFGLPILDTAAISDQFIAHEAVEAQAPDPHHEP